MKRLVLSVYLVFAGIAAVPALACTTAIISAEASGTGRPMLWKHRDTDEFYNHIEYIQGPKYGFTALVNTRDTVRHEVWAGVNEKGFAIANNVSYNINTVKYDNPSRNGYVMMDALGVCASVDEFEKFIQKMAVPRGTRANFAVIDAHGGAAYFEVGDDRYVRFDVKDSPHGYLYRTNFSLAGVKDKGAGYIRYEAAKKLFEGKRSGFTPEWILANPARSFYHGLMKTDMNDVPDEELGEGYIISQDYIPRYTTVSSLVIEGVNPGEDPRNVIMWSAIGYAPCSYAIPVWVGARNEIPTCLTSQSGELAPANDIAMKLKDVVFPIQRGNGNKYLDYKTLRQEIMPEVLQAELEEVKAAQELKEKFARKGFDLKAVKAFNAGADERMSRFCEKMTKVTNRPTEEDKTENAGTAYLKDAYQTYDDIQKKIHSLAELGYMEYESSELLASHLEAHGFKVERGVAGIPTAFTATFGSGSPVIGLLAEYDALPGMSQDTVPFKKAVKDGGTGHGCGHNLLGTGSVAGAVAISKWLAEGRTGTVKLFGCPAEEGGGGKAYMAREGCFDGVDAILDWHPDVCNLVNVESGLANVQIRFTFHGTPSHASSAPEKGRSALDAVEAFNHMMNLMREHVPEGTRIHYVITEGGKAPNVVPDKAQVLYYFRNADRKVVAELKERALKAAEGAACGTGTTVEHEIVSGNFERLYNGVLAKVLQKNLELAGGVVYDEKELAFAKEMLANSGIEDLSVLEKPSAVLPLGADYPTLKGVSSDVGNVTWVAPTASFRAATFVPAGSGHCWQFTSSGGTSIGTKGLMNVAKVMLYTAVDLYESPETVAAAKKEYESKVGKDFVFEPLIGDKNPPLDYRK